MSTPRKFGWLRYVTIMAAAYSMVAIGLVVMVARMPFDDGRLS